jgi:hypothetical protein
VAGFAGYLSEDCPHAGRPDTPSHQDWCRLMDSNHQTAAYKARALSVRAKPALQGSDFEPIDTLRYERRELTGLLYPAHEAALRL